MKRNQTHLVQSLLIVVSLLFIISGCKKDIIESIEVGTFIDSRDDQEYKWVKIGSQKWMAENLNYETTSGSWCYANSLYNCSTYGLLYDGETILANDHGNGTDICPEGWHLPTDEEWKKLEENLGMTAMVADGINWRDPGNVGEKLKSNLGWDFNSGNNESKFEALPGGRMTRGDAFTDAGKKANFWTATEYNDFNLYFRQLSYDSHGVYRRYYDLEGALSVRCVEN